MTAVVLDCESFESAVESSAAILGLGAGDLVARLRAFECEQIPPAEGQVHPYENLLPEYAIGIAHHDLPTPLTVHWFHASRVRRGTTFDEGILPVSAILDRIWTFLGDLAREWSTQEEWNRFRREMRGQGAEQYRMKVGCGHDEGPFAFLVREIIFCWQEMGNHDYLSIPEIVEDICLSYETRLGHALRERFVAATRPSIVKFRSRDPRPDALKAALMYIHRKARKEDLCISCNTCYTGEGVPIGRNDILKVEWPEDFEA